MKNIILLSVVSTILFLNCTNPQKDMTEEVKDFKFLNEQFADIKILRYQVPGFDELTLDQKKLIYYLSEAARCGRDILFDQNGKYNLMVRDILENIYTTYNGDKTTEEFKAFEVYLKRVWFSNGIHHHYSTDKFQPDFDKAYFTTLIENSNRGELGTIENLDLMDKILFDPDFMPKRVSQDASKDLVTNSACNFYENITEKEVTDYYESIKDENDPTPISYGLNTKIIKENGKVKEIVYKADGMYGPAIKKIISWLEKALPYSETEIQKKSIEKLIEYYKSGDLVTWDEYNILWVKDLNSQVDFINGFIEVYGDPMGMKATWESVVNFKDMEATKRTEKLSENAQWFEDNSPVDPRFKKDSVKGVSAKVITVAQLGGDCYPSTPIGINLPNADWIRKDHGSKSVTIENITYAYDQVSLASGFLDEFAYNDTEKQLAKKYGSLTGNLHTDLHECLGHGSGQMLPGVSSEALKNYHSPLEETRADLFALYYIADPKMVELGILPDMEAFKSEYIGYIRNGLMTQLRRIEPGKNIEQAHMRNRQLISKWCYENGKADNVIEKITEDGKTYFVINDFNKLRELFGELLAEAQRIKSEGDYKAGKALVETYGVKVDPVLHAEVIERYDNLKIAPYSGFLNPDFELIEKDGEIIDIKITYPDNYTKQMLRYSQEYGFL